MTQVCVDIVVQVGNEVLLIKRSKSPFKDMYAFPGGRVELTDDDLEGAAKRELLEETGIRVIGQLQYVKTIGNCWRDPRGFTTAIVYKCMLMEKPEVHVGSDACDYKWINVDSLPVLAFDHNTYIENPYVSNPFGFTKANGMGYYDNVVEEYNI